MKRNHRLVGVIALTAALSAGMGAAVAGGKHGGWNDYGRGELRAVYKVDNLTPEQRQQIDALVQSMREEKAQWREERQALRDAMRSGADVETIRPLAEQQGDRVTRRILKRAEARAQLKQILTPEQQAQLQELGERCDRRDRRRWN